ncbi:nitroreductase family protein [Mycobacterium sp.]|uniref:nitroreductase family protein n=1 Tax=Mycobacterium sp. TaxID=1785 RepID=UPI003BACEAB2
MVSGIEETTMGISGSAMDPAAVDYVLTTTRSVRKRLDLNRSVDPQVILDCIDVAEQAPSGGNQASRRWIVVDDPRRKRQLADLYREAAGDFILGARDQLAGTGHPQAKVMESAAYLVEHLAEVPAIVLPTIIGRHDNSGRAGLFDSVIQAAWSFCLALRARGLGSAWVTAVFARERELKEMLGIPDNVTEIVMLPVAHTIGTDFKRAPRRPARAITYYNTYGHTFEHGPNQPATFDDGAGGEVEIDVEATPEQLWPLVTDINFGAGASDEFRGAEWAVAEGPRLGARFVGRNWHEALGEWAVDCFVDVFEVNRVFGWRTSDPDAPGARWRFELEPIVGGTRLRHAVTIGPGPSGLTQALTSMPDKQQRILHRRVSEIRLNMARVVAAMKERAESDRRDSRR